MELSDLSQALDNLRTSAARISGTFADLPQHKLDQDLKFAEDVKKQIEDVLVPLREHVLLAANEGHLDAVRGHRLIAAGEEIIMICDKIAMEIKATMQDPS